ncbi:MAG TPA: ABC transporter permease [Thermoanaerobaculia bacterium]|nr:ABC transporter permease [Thermoanaerobaculia bacterium]
MIRHLLKLVWNRKRANALIVAEIFISFLVVFAVLTGAVTLITGWRQPLGFSYGDVWDVRMEFDFDANEKAPPELLATVARMLDEARGLPQVAAAGISTTPAYSFSTSEGTRGINGREVTMLFDDVDDGFAEVMKLQVLSGRWFSKEDDAAQYRPVVLDRNAAEAIYGSTDVIGRTFEENEETTCKVVGVVAPYRKDGEASLPMNMVFRRIAPDGSYGRLGNHILLRLHPGTPADFEPELVARLQKVAPAMSFRVRHMDQMRGNFLRTRFSPIVLGGVVGMFLIAMVTLGLTGVLWQTVTRRTREIGLRRALGASGIGVRRQILLEVALLATIALVAGSAIILQLPILGVFTLVTPAAFVTGFAAALATIYALTVVCGLYPSWLASRLEPADALRYE